MARLNLTLGEVRDVIGDGAIFGHSGFVCKSVMSLDRAGHDDLSFVKSQKYVQAAKKSRAGALLVPEALGGTDARQLVLSDPVAGLGKLLHWISEKQCVATPGVHHAAQIAEDVAEQEQVWGNPARPKMEEMRIRVLLGELGDMKRELRELREANQEVKG